MIIFNNKLKKLRYFTLNTRQKLKNIINKLNNKEKVSLAERIFLSKYSSKFPNLLTKIKEKSLKSS
tara:strand:- start:756 stop:953 length:198 start_codon:yes stop_codon:yes gene_type:complete